MKYLDFDLLIERFENGYRARVINSPAGQAVVEFSIPFSELEIENYLLKFGRPRRGLRFVNSPEMVAARSFGQRLFEVVFAGEVYSRFRSSLDEAKRSKAGLRLRIRLTETPELIDVPWEYLYNPSLDRFLSLALETPIVRYLDLPESIHPLEVEPPLNVLVMIASPYNYPQLDVEQEWKNIKESVNELEKHGLINVQRMQSATLSALQMYLRKGTYQIFHFIGHGKFDRKNQDGQLIIEDSQKRGREVSAHTLGTLLHNHPSLRLVVLNACEGARASRTDPFAGAAQSLVRQGIPAVIAMQFEITDEAATTLAHEFYSALADGFPVDAALVEARTSIFAEGNDIEWGTPVLYMRSPDGQIFDVHRPELDVSTNGKLAEPVRALRTSQNRNRSIERLGCTLSIVLASVVFAIVVDGVINLNERSMPALTDSLSTETTPADAEAMPAVPISAVMVQVEPPNSETLIDGMQMPPIQFLRNRSKYELQAGWHTISVSQTGYIAWQDSFEVKPGQVDTLKIFLAPKTEPQETRGTVIVTVKPRGSIYIDYDLRQPESSLPYTARLEAGEYILTAIHPEGRRWERRVRIVAGESTEQVIDFDKKVTLTVKAAPLSAWGDIYIDGQNTGFQTPRKIPGVPIGLHTIEVKGDEYQTQGGGQTLNVESDTTLTFQLEEIY